MLGENRSYDCQLYPYYPINLNEDYTVVLLKLCPNIGSEIVNNACTQSRERIIELVKKSEELSKREGYKKNIIDEKYRISDYIPEKINLVKCASLKYSTVEDFLKLVFFQLVFVPLMIFLESEIIFKLFDIYMYYMYSLIKADASQNIQNMQIFLENRIFKVALYRYFYPWNEKVLLSENENIILFNYYQKRDLNSKVIKVLNLYFKYENTIWKKAY
ncbi:hypothetical protein HMPREF1987_00223 [Peptostreptococcaceae bacterium oral taxon 113 str. W5053]|nr:hypothetical protein HMPREF1987_00223 [Peptostreptococcaceae bacterium oral taxon 113 str. W5053]